MKIIDQENWDRKSQYDYFRRLPQPHVSLTADVDVTGLIKKAKPAGVSVFNACLFAVLDASNKIVQFRQRIRGDEVVEYDRVHPGSTVPIEGDRFALCRFDFVPDWTEFDSVCRETFERAKQQTELKDDTGDRLDFIFTTCLPWLHFTSLHHPVRGPQDSFPRVAWGKFTQHGSQWKMPLNVQANHALVDGAHLARFYELTQEALDRFGE